MDHRPTSGLLNMKKENNGYTFVNLFVKFLLEPIYLVNQTPRIEKAIKDSDKLQEKKWK